MKIVLGKAVECDSERRNCSIGSLRLVVGIASAGRPMILREVLMRLGLQTRAPDSIMICAPEASDVDGVVGANPSAVVILGHRGSSHQRNAILRRAGKFDVIVFFDDDFVPCADYLEWVERIMVARPDVVMTTGRVLQDGVLGPGLTFEVADAVVNGVCPIAVDTLKEVSNGYGCNMSVRVAMARKNGISFDERLPLYGWLEDVDFSHQLARFGHVVMSEATRGVHLGIKVGRTPGIKLGYSQIANPLYLMRKGTLKWSRGLLLMSRNLIANSARSFRAEAWVDRPGRLMGNLLAVLDLVRGRLDPGRIALL